MTENNTNNLRGFIVLTLSRRARRATRMALRGAAREAYIFADEPVRRRRDRVSERRERREVEEWSKHNGRAVR